MEELKQQRTNSKRNLTRIINNLRRKIAEDEIITDISEIKKLFLKFEQDHEEYHNALEDESEIDDSEKYFQIKQDDYVKVLEQVKDHGRSKGETKWDTSSGNLEDLFGKMNLPKLELETFDGDPKRYHEFIRSFELNVERLTPESDVRLSRLIQYTRGPAREAIRGSQLIGGSLGYEHAKDVLENRFGNSHLVCNQIVKDLRKGKNIKTAKEILQLSDNMKTSQLVLKKLGMMAEVNSQATIVEIVSRLEPGLQSKWKILTLNKKREAKHYAEFSDLVDFVSQCSDDLNDPVYGQISSLQKEKPVQDDGRLQSRSPKIASAATEVREYLCVLCSSRHGLWSCPRFKEKSPEERLDFVIRHKLCQNCLLSNHTAPHCWRNITCRVCGRKHSTFLHISRDSSSSGMNFNNCNSLFTGNNNNNDVNGTSSSSNCNVNDANRSRISSSFCKSNDQVTCMPIVRVKVNNSFDTFALLDTGSST